MWMKSLMKCQNVVDQIFICTQKILKKNCKMQKYLSLEFFAQLQGLTNKIWALEQCNILGYIQLHRLNRNIFEKKYFLPSQEPVIEIVGWIFMKISLIPFDWLIIFLHYWLFNISYTFLLCWKSRNQDMKTLSILLFGHLKKLFDDHAYAFDHSLECYFKFWKVFYIISFSQRNDTHPHQNFDPQVYVLIC